MEWVGERISIADLAADPDALRNWVHKRLRGLMYHNFPKVDHYYRGAIGISIFPDGTTKSTLMSFVPIRHDCVHRYGRDHAGREHKVIKTRLKVLGDALEAVVTHVEASLARWKSRSP